MPSVQALHRAIVVVDVAGFTDRARTTIHQSTVHSGLYDVLTEAFREAGVDLRICTVEDRGDGAMILVPPKVPKAVLAVRLPYLLAGALRRYNAVHSAEANIRFRVVLHAGEVRLKRLGVVSQAVNQAFRMVEADEAKRALQHSGGELALIVSDPFYQDVVVHDPAAYPDSYRSISVAVKGFAAKAWLRLLPDLSHGYEVSSVPKVWGHVPPRNPIFIGREQLLGRLGQRVAARGTAVILPASALHGMGGVGKTQLATEYVYRRLDQYDIVWWIQSAQLAQIRAELTRLAQQLDLPGSGNADTAVPAVLEALRLGRPYQRWLLVFDAADSLDLVRPYLPTNGPGETLITSRNPNWARVASPLEVAVFSRGETAELLRRRGLDVDTDDTDRLAEKLGDLPLAVDQAAAWQVETGTPVDEYLRLFDEQAEILNASALTDYEVALGAAWNVSFDELERNSPAAYRLLQVCAFFAAGPVARTLFTHARVSVNDIAPELDASLGDPLKISQAVRDINRYGLAKIDHRSGTLVLHRLVQLMLRNRMASEERGHMRHVAHMLLANYDPNDPNSTTQWLRYHDILPHVYASELVQCNDPAVRRLVINMAQFMTHWGAPEEGVKLAQHACDRWREVYGEDSEEVLWARHIVAHSVRCQGEFRLASCNREEIYQDAERLLGHDHPLTLMTIQDLAVAAHLCGHYQRALELDEHVYQRRVELLGKDDRHTLNSLTGIIIDRRELGNYREARLQHEEHAERVRELFAADERMMLVTLTSLAVARRKDGDHVGAVALSGRVLNSCRQAGSDGQPSALVCALAHSIDLRYAGDLDGARELGDKVLRQLREGFSRRHPYALAAEVDLAVTLRRLGDLEGARRHVEYALGEFRAALGADHPHAIATAINLGALGAAEVGAEAIARAERVLGPDHPITRAAEARVDCDIDPLPL